MLIAGLVRDRFGGIERAAREAGVTRGALASWIQGRRSPLPQALARLEAVLQGDTGADRDRRIAAYAARVEATGGWRGGGHVWEARPARPLSWLSGVV